MVLFQVSTAYSSDGELQRLANNRSENTRKIANTLEILKDMPDITYSRFTLPGYSLKQVIRILYIWTVCLLIEIDFTKL